MKINKWFMFLAALGIIFVLPFFYQARAAGQPTERQLTITAKTFGYTPATFSVNEGDHVKITLVAEDVSHGFYLDGYDISIVARPKEEAHTEFIASKTGKFSYRCSETCGVLHPFMIGNLTVEPNSPLNFSLALAGIVMVGTLAYIVLRKEKV